jgi:hypothetical protein
MSTKPVTAEAAPKPSSRYTSAVAIAIYVALARVLLYVIATRNYGYNRDELYYLACGEHPAWGYVDQPPLIAWIAWLVEHTLGTSLYAIRLLPALAGAATILLTGLIAKEFGGKRWAVFLSSAASMLGLEFLALTHVLSMNAFDLPLWTLLAWLLVRIVKYESEKLWLAVGAALGLTLLNKYAVAFLAAGLLLGVVLTPLRRSLARRWFWLGAAIGFAIALPNFIWQMHRHYPFLELMRNVRASGRDIALAPLKYLADQATLIGWAAVPLVVLALFYLFAGKGRHFAVLAWGFVTMTALMVVLHGKGPYLAPLYPMMFAAGATMFEQITESGLFRWLRGAYAVALIALSLIAAPLAFPILPAETFIQYTVKIGVEQPHYENQAKGRMPQFYADMYGWEERVRMVASYYNALPLDERARTAILASNYGDAGAIDLFGPKYGLPKAISTHQNYWFWGPRQYTGESLILIGGGDLPMYQQECRSFTLVGVPDNPYARPDANAPIYHCRNWNQNLPQAWPGLKKWN